MAFRLADAAVDVLRPGDSTVKVLNPMRRMTFVIALCALTTAGSVLAQTGTSSTQTAPTQTSTQAPPPTQTPPPKPTPTPTAGQKPAPTPTPPPRPVLPFPEGAKIAYIDLALIVDQSQLGKDGRAAMSVLNEKLTAGLTDKQKAIVALQDQIKAQQNVVAESKLQEMVRNLERLQREAQFAQQDAQVQVDQLNQELIKNLQDKVLPIVEQVRKDRDLHIIFVLGENSNIAAAHGGLDLTMEVVKRLDAATIKK